MKQKLLERIESINGCIDRFREKGDYDCVKFTKRSLEEYIECGWDLGILTLEEKRDLEDKYKVGTYILRLK